MIGPQTLCYVRAPGRLGPPFPVNPEPRQPSRRSVRAPVSEPDPATVWHRFRAELRRTVSESTWRIWLEPVGLHDVRGGTVFLDVPEDRRAWVETRFGRLLALCAESVLGPDAQVAFERPTAEPEPELPPPARSSTRD